ncbi:MAG: hypothetical protein RMJ86_10005 [Anaerolineae bacterium]|nr:hypothetical protein [Anaerolineae bacterium]MDW8293158.1 hypothetical protein [Anaerolineae bacterium]
MGEETQPTVPPWADRLGEHLGAFLSLVKAYFAQRDMSITLDLARGTLQLVREGNVQSSVIGLRNLAQLCAQSPIEQWQSLVALHFDSLLDYFGENQGVQLLQQLAQARDRLRSRIYPEEILSHTPDLVYRPGPAGTLEVLVVDLPTSVRTIARREAEAWGVETDALLDLGRRNLRRFHALERHPIALQPGVSVDIYTSDPYYTASFALLPEVWLADRSAHGALVTLPRRDTLIVHVIRDLGVMDAMEALLRAAIDLHAEGPGSISPFVYWHRDGEFIKLPYTLEGDTLRLELPESFVALLNALERAATLS